MNEIAQKIIRCFKRGNFVYICGNGGSAAMASHFATEFMGKFRHDRKPLPAIALTTDTSFITAHSNDYPKGFEGIFTRQITALGRKGDILITLSTSGKSKNILLAIGEAKLKGMKVIQFPTNDETGGETHETQMTHLYWIHEISKLVEEAFYDNTKHSTL